MGSSTLLLSRRFKRLWARMCEPGALRMLYHGLSLAPRLIVHMASIAALAGLCACVPASRYEQVKSAGDVQAAGRRQAEAELEATRGKLEAATATLALREQKLSETEAAVSQSKFESSVAQKERDEATGLVDQLRGELGRVGDDLRIYARERAELQQSLDAAQARKVELEKSEARTVAIARLTRDLTSALGDRVTSGDVTLDVREGRVVVGAPSELWFDEANALGPGSDALLAACARVLALQPQSVLEVTDSGPLADRHAQTLERALVARGVAASRMHAAPFPPPAPPLTVVPSAPSGTASTASASGTPTTPGETSPGAGKQAPVDTAKPSYIELSFSAG